MQQVTEKVFVETGFMGCNTSFVVTSEGVVVIDTPMVPAEAKKWQKLAAEHGQIRYVINTEPHTDHAAGNCWFGATVVAHDGTRQVISEAKTEDLTRTLRDMAPHSLPVDPAFRYLLPSITFSQNMTIYLGGLTFHLISTPGHTASETAVYIPEEKIVFTGDNVNLRIPIFIKSFPYEWIKSLKRLQDLDVEKLVPGHGEVSDKSSLTLMADAVQYWVDKVKADMYQGLSLEEAQNKLSIAEKFPMARVPMLSTMVRNSIADLYRSLKS